MLSLLDNDVSRYILHTVRSLLLNKPASRSKPLAWNRSSGQASLDPPARSHHSVACSGLKQAMSMSRRASRLATVLPMSAVQPPSWITLLYRNSSSSNRPPAHDPPPPPPSSDIPIYRRAQEKGGSRNQFLDDPVGLSGKAVSALTPANIEAFRHARPFEDIPGPTTIYHTIPFAGTRLLYYPFSNEKTEDMGTMLSRLQASFGPIMRVKMGTQWVVFIENINDIEHVIQAFDNEMAQMPRPIPPARVSPLNRLTVKPTKDIALAVLDLAPKPQKLRNAVGKYINNRSTVKQYLVRQSQMARDLSRLLELLQHSPLEVQCLISRYSLEVCGDLCFSQRLGLLGDHYLANGDKQKLVESYCTVIRCLGEIQTGTRVLHNIFDDPFAKRLKEARKTANAWERQQMRETTMTAIREKGMSSVLPEERSLLISLLDDKSLTEEEIADTLHAMMTTESEGLSSVLQMMLYSLATNVDKQEKVVAEIMKVLGPDGELNSDSVSSLVYLFACLMESTRLHPPLASGGQVTLSNNIVLSNYLVPGGTPIEVNSRRTAKNPLWFDHPHFFLPERWLTEGARDIPKLATMPLGFGTHNCRGIANFLGQAIATVVVKILQKYKVDLPEEYQSGQLTTVHTPFLMPKTPFPFIFTLRDIPPYTHR